MSQKNRNKHQMRVLLEVLAAATLACLVSTNSALTEAAQDVSATPAQVSKPAPLPQNPGGFVLRSQVNLVLVDVRVWDKSGHPVTDFKAEDFKIFEDGATGGGGERGRGRHHQRQRAGGGDARRLRRFHAG